jgi:predicted ArsR family transcriptional regulator
MRLTTRLRILDYLRKQQTASAGELSLALALTGANIRHHLGVLEANELVEVIGQRREGGRGRPVNLYSLSRRVLGDGLDALASAVLRQWLAGQPEPAQREALRSLARHLLNADPKMPDLSLTQRLAATIDRLNQLHYQARWEAAASGPRLVLGHCPYAAIIEAHPELCLMDADLLEEGLRSTIVQTAKLQPGARGLPICVFLVNLK